MNGVPPVMPTYNVKQYQVNNVANYVNDLSNRLSIPKLKASGSTKSLEKYLNSKRDKDEYKARSK